jgi:hypothetical protein
VGEFDDYNAPELGQHSELGADVLDCFLIALSTSTHEPDVRHRRQQATPRKYSMRNLSREQRHRDLRRQRSATTVELPYFVDDSGGKSLYDLGSWFGRVKVSLQALDSCIL